MNKIHLLHEAENLYSVENLTPEMIAEKLNISRRTVFNWKKKYKWDNHIVRIKDSSNQFVSDINNKPAYLMRNEKLHKQLHNDFVPTLEETIKMIDMWLNFKNSQPCPNEPDKTIAEEKPPSAPF